MYRSIFGILLVIFIAGCSIPGGIFGGDIIDIVKEDVESGERNMVVIKSIESIPGGVVLPDQNVRLSFILENRDKVNSVNARVDLFNAPGFKDRNGELCNSDARPCQPVDSGGNNICTDGGCKLLPGEEKQINFNLKSPSEEEIADIRTTSHLSFKAEYDFEGKLIYSVPVISEGEIIKRQITGDKLSVKEISSHGPGPIVMDAGIYGAPYILSGSETNINFKIMDEGNGRLKNNEIAKNSIIICIPNSIGGVVSLPEGFGTGDNKCGEGYNSYTNTQKISMYKDEVKRSILFRIDAGKIENEPFKTYTMKAFVDYTYELDDGIDITVNPLHNV